MKMENRSLQSVLRTAKKEMKQEAGRKISDITGYASNNSRALQRRRSSVSEYVGMSHLVKDHQRQETDVCESSKSPMKPSIRNVKHNTIQQEEAFSSLSDEDHMEEEVKHIVVIQRRFAHRAPSVGQYFDM